MKKFFYISTGLLALGLALIGVILPILPTTPFLLFASFCFVKGSKRFSTWFETTKIYQCYLANYVRQGAMTKKQKWTILLIASLMLLIPLVMIDSLVMKGIIILLYVGKYCYFIVKIPTLIED